MTKVCITKLTLYFLAASVLLVASSSGQVWAAKKPVGLLALGDSYTSGNGGLEYYGSKGCYRSANSYVEIYASTLRRRSLQASVDNLACSGAKIVDVYKQLSTLSQVQKHAVDIVYLSVGGNDAGFSQAVKYCLVPTYRNSSTCRAITYWAHRRLPDLAGQVDSMLGYLLGQLPNAQIKVVGYPYLAASCSKPWSYHFLGGRESVGRIRYLSERADRFLSETAHRIGRVEYISTLQLFAGHEVCGRKQNYIRNSFDTFIKREWWHLNKEGHRHLGFHLARRAN